MKHRNAVKTQWANAVDCEIDHPEFGWIETTVTQDDNPELFSQIMRGKVAEFTPPPPPGDDARTLSPPQFAYLLALTGFDDVWDTLEKHFKAKDRAQYASLKAERSRSYFVLSRTLEIVATFRPMAAQIAPDTDLSEKAIRDGWAKAETFGGQGHG